MSSNQLGTNYSRTNLDRRIPEPTGDETDRARRVIARYVTP